MTQTVCFVESSASMGGVEFSTLYLIDHMDHDDWEPFVVCPAEGDLPNACREAGVPVEIIPFPLMRSTSLRFGIDRRLPNPLAWGWNLIVLWVATLRLRRFFRRHPVDLVVTKGMAAHFYGGLAARLLGIPCIWHVQDLISERFWGVYRRIWGMASNIIPNFIVADGLAIAQQMPSTVRNRLTVIYNGVDTDTFRPGLDGQSLRSELGIPPHATVIGNVARLTPWKGQHYLVEAFASVAAEFPSAYLLLVGAPVFDNDAYERHLLERVDELGLNERVVFAGYRYDLPQTLAAMDIFAYTSIEKDTSPLSLLSAMAAGLPVVAFDIMGVREVVGDSGLLTPVRSHRDLALAIRTVLDDPAKQHALQRESRNKACQVFSLQSHVHAMEKVFLAVLTRSQ